MKQKSILVLLAVAAFITFAAFSLSNNIAIAPQEKEKPDLGFPDEVEGFVSKSCYGCHNDEARNDDAKSALNFSQWNKLTDKKKIKALDEICSALEGEDMPPGKFLEK